MGDAALTHQSLRAQIVSDPAQAAALRRLFGAEGVAEIDRNVARLLLDGDGLDTGRASLAFENAPAAASVPLPSADLAYAPAERGIVTDPRSNTIETTDGYRFTFEDNQVRIDWPGRTEDGVAETVFAGNRAIEGDGTEWRAENGNYVLPNGAMFTLAFDDEGRIDDFTLVHGDSRVDVAGIGDGDPQIGRVRDGGYAHRMDRVEGNAGGATFRMGGHNDGWSNLDVTWNAEMYGQNLGVMSEDGADLFSGYVVDPALKPEFGTQDYERMIRAEIEDVRSVISGNYQAAGASNAYGDLVADYMLGTSGTYDRYANELQASQGSRTGGQQYQMQQLEQFLSALFGGMPMTHDNWAQGMQALQQLMSIYAQSRGMQNDYQQATSNLRSYIPSVQRQLEQQGLDPALLVDQIVNGVGNRRRAVENGRLERFDLAGGGRTRGNTEDVNAALLRNRIQNGPSRLSNPRETVERLVDKLSYGAFDWAVTDGEARDVIREMSTMTDRDLAQVAEHMGPDMIARLEDNLSDEDRTRYGSTLDRLRAVTNLPRTTLERSGESAGGVAEEVNEPLERGVFDWVVTDGDAREAIDRLSRYSERDLQRVVDEMGPDMVTRLVDNLSDEDRAHYAQTIDRLTAARNDRRENVGDMRGEVDEIRDDLERGVFDWAVTDGNARDAIDRLSQMSDEQLAQAVEHVGPDLLTRLEEQLSDTDKQQYAGTLQRIREARNEPGRTELRDPNEVAEELEDHLSYGVFDWAVTDGEARETIDQLARYDDRDLAIVLDRLGPDMTSRLMDQLSGADREAYAETIESIDRVRNTPRRSLENARQVVEDIEDRLSYGAFDWNISDGEARAVVDQLSQYQNGDLRQLVQMIDPDLLNRLESNLSDEDRRAYATTLDRLRQVR